MKYPRNGFGLVVLVAAFLGGVSNLSAQSLTDALIYSYQNSQTLISGRASLRATDEGVAQAWSALRPSLTGSASRSVVAPIGRSGPGVFTTNIRLSTELLLWDGGGTRYAVEVARLTVAAARETLVETEQTVLLTAVTAFMDMRQNAQFLQLAENTMHVIAQQVQATKDRFEVGDVTRTSVSQAEARLASAVSDVAFRQGSLEIARETYFVSIGVYPGTLQPPPPIPRIPASLAAAKSVALRSHPSVLRTKFNLQAAEFNIYRAEAVMKPSISISGNLNSSSSTTGDTGTLSLSGSLPIYQGGLLVSQLRQAYANKEVAHAQMRLAGLQVSQNVARYWATTDIARASIIARQKQVRSARVALRGVREEANLGARTTLDVLDAERELVRAETDLVAAKRDEYVAVYSLLSAMGLLTVHHLQLGIASYDPNVSYKKIYLAPVKTERGKILERIFTRAGKKK